MNNNEKVAKCIDDTKILDGESKSRKASR
jgi:hypothetical protein